MNAKAKSPSSPSALKPASALRPPSSVLRLLASAFIMLTGIPHAAEPQTAIRLLVRADDMGVTHSGNEACIESFRNGIARSTEVIVPGAWFLHAVKLLNENPGLDVGVHLTLTSEWERCKWRPLTLAPSLSDKDGYFRPMNSQRKDFPPDTGFLEANPKLDEVERELRAQIEVAKRHLPRISHVSAHMGTPVCTPALRELTTRLGREYGLRLEATGVQGAPGFGGSDKTAEQKEQDLVNVLEKLGPGQWLIVEHPAFDTPEMRAIGHQGYENVAADRAGVTQAFTSRRVREVIRRRGIQLISYAELK
jgi:predicted glycoside hydrolase/deacetylase ChbG (UPF0249 family)